MSQIKKIVQKYWFILAFLLVLIFAVFTRFYKVTSFPPSLYGEEYALGYDAYSVLKTGKDHLGNPAPLVAFESYGDYKPAFYFYAMMPGIALLGLNELSVRLPSMIAGVLIVIGTGLIGRALFISENKEHKKLFQVLMMFLVTISPWAVEFSRAGWESNLATCFIVWGVWFGLTAKKKSYISKAICAFVLLALSMYTYHSARVIAPFLGLGLMLVWGMETEIFAKKLLFKKEWWKKVRSFLFKVIPIGLFFVLLIFPLLSSLRDKTTQERFDETNIFADGHAVIESNHYQDLAHHTVWAHLFYHRYVFYAKEFIANYLLHFSFQFLFVSGDNNLRHSVQYVGQLYLLDSFFIVLGLFFLFRNWRKEYGLLLFWLLIGVVPAGLTTAAPHALRILPTMPVFLLITGFGVWEAVMLFSKIIKKWIQFPHTKLVVAVVILFVYLIQFTAFWEFYSKVYPKLYYGVWEYGYKQVIAEVNARKGQEQHVYFVRDMDRPAMSYWFFSLSDPREVQKIDRKIQQDQGAPLQFGNITFVDTINQTGSGLVASSVESEQTLEKEKKSITNKTEIKDPAGKTIWMVYHVE